MNNEVWKAYPEYPFIQVNRFGEIRAVDRYVSDGKGGKRFVKGHALKQRRDRNGYLYVAFSVAGKSVYLSAHRVIAKCFLPNPLGLPQVNHKDCDRANNCVDNLEWCTSEYNNAYREKYGTAQNKPVYAVNLKTLEISRFESQSEASRALGVNVGNLNSVLTGRYKQTKGYWFIEDDGDGLKIDKDKLRNMKN